MIETPTIQRGGFRPDHHQRPARGPAYERCREFPEPSPLTPPPHRRSAQWAWRYRLHIWSAVEDGTLPLTTASVGMVISRFGDKQGRNAFPNRKTIGTKLGGMSPRSVTRHTKRLVTAGWLAKVHRHHVTPDGVRGKSNLYQLMMPPEVEATVPTSQPARQRPAASANGSTRPPAGPPKVDVEDLEPLVDERLVAAWKAELATLDSNVVEQLAAQHLPTMIATRTGTLRTRLLANALAAIGPP